MMWSGSVRNIMKKCTTVPVTKLFEYLIIIYKAIDMFNFITSFKKDVKTFIANAEARFKTLEDKIDRLIHAPATAVDAVKAAPAEVVAAVEAEVNKVD